MAVVTLCWQLSNVILLFTLFMSILGLLSRIHWLHVGRINRHDLSFLLFYIFSSIAIFLQWLVINGPLIFSLSSLTYVNIALWFKGALWFLILSSGFLIYIGQNSFVIRKFSSYRYYSHFIAVLYFFCLAILILLVITEVTTIDIIENSPAFDFNPQITLPLTALYGSIIGGLFAFISIRSRMQTLNEPVKHIVPLYPLYLGFTVIGGCCLIIIGFIIIIDPFPGSIWPCLRIFLSSVIYLIFLWFPTMESMFEIFFQTRMDRLETIMGRDKVLDIIDHDLANVTQILHSYFETIQLSNQEREFLKKQVDRMSKLITESRALVIHEDDTLVQELMNYYKSTRVQNNLSKSSSETKKEV